MAKIRTLTLLVAAAQHALAQSSASQTSKGADVPLGVAVIRGAMTAAKAQMGRSRPALLDSVSFARFTGGSLPSEIASAYGDSATVAVGAPAVSCAASAQPCMVNGDRVFLQLVSVSLGDGSAVASVQLWWTDRPRDSKGIVRSVITHGELEVRLARRGNDWQILSAKFLRMS